MIEKALALKVWAVVGATGNKDKFGWKIYNRLVKNGYEVYPVNPGVEEIAGAKCYPTLEALPVTVDVVNVVVPANIAVITVKDAAACGAKFVWLQPGADKPEVVAAAKEAGIASIEACVLHELLKRK